MTLGRTNDNNNNKHADRNRCGDIHRDDGIERDSGRGKEEMKMDKKRYYGIFDVYDDNRRELREEIVWCDADIGEVYRFMVF